MERVNVVGAGLAGLSAAVSLAGRGRVCNLISVQPSERAQSVLAEGGINAALDTMSEGDTVAEHFADTMRGGAELSDPNAVAGLVSHAPDILRWLVRLGVPFQMNGGQLVLRNFGGQKKKRTAYAKSSTGKIIMSGLIDEARKFEATGEIIRYPHHEVLELVFEEKQDGKCCCGLKMLDLFTDELYFCSGPVILATGGLGGMFSEWTTGTVQNTGDLVASAFVHGVELANLEFIQYHPTTVQIPGKRLLVSEAARGEGGRLYILRSGSPWYFMEELYPELGNLMPRDVISREMVKACARNDCGGQVYLDLSCLSRNVWDQKLSDLREELIAYLSVDPAKAPVAVAPGIHYFMGGIAVDDGHRTNVPALYAAGECACQYHGANRLGGNSMLGAIYGGKVAAQSAAAEMKPFQMADGNSAPERLGLLPEEQKNQRRVSPAAAKGLRDILLSALGILRNGEQIDRSLQAIDKCLTETRLTGAEKNRLLLGKAMLLSALARQESRGAHFRTDWPQRDDRHFQKTTVSVCTNGEIAVEFRAIPERRAAHGNPA